MKPYRLTSDRSLSPAACSRMAEDTDNTVSFKQRLTAVVHRERSVHVAKNCTSSLSANKELNNSGRLLGEHSKANRDA